MSNTSLDKLKLLYKGKRVLIVGLGLQGGGLAATRFFAKLGAKITVTDLKSKEQLLPTLSELKGLSIDFVLGEHRMKDFLLADLIIKGPSVRWDLPELVAAEKAKIPIDMEAAFFTSICQAPIVGVTGTRGKSTTANLIYKVLKDNNIGVHLGGNLPNASPLGMYDNIKSSDWVVFELSSWQLSGFHRRKISPHISVFTNLYPDHLNYYQSMEEYYNDKKAVFQYQKDTDYTIFNKRYLNLLGDKHGKLILYGKNNVDFSIMSLSGEHNRENVAACLATIKLIGIDKYKAKSSINHFLPLTGRLQTIKKINNITFVNDTTATTPVATIKAVQTYKNNRIILILGGNSKQLSFDELIPELSKVKKIFLLKGTLTDLIHPMLKELYQDKISQIYDDLSLAVKEAYRVGKETNDPVVILLSPGATSFAMFANEFERGSAFNKVVDQLK